jgi:alpha-ketoglutarate-dependent taurine dioxygenase
MQVEPMPASLGAYVSDVRLADLTEEEWQEIHAAFLQYGVLGFPEQKLSQSEQVAFGSRFGELSSRGYAPAAREQHPGLPRATDGVIEMSNVDAEGRIITDPQNPQVLYLAGNDVWHTDNSYSRVSAKASCLSCVECPTEGGETAFADMRAALDALSPEERARVAGLRAFHSLEYSQALRGVEGATVPADPRTLAGAWHAMVRRHPETGRESLYIGRHACAIEGMELAEAQALLADLLDRACQPPRVVAHKWNVGDVIVWDNRCLLHRVQPWDLRQRRLMWHVRIAGEETEAA